MDNMYLMIATIVFFVIAIILAIVRASYNDNEPNKKKRSSLGSAMVVFLILFALSFVGWLATRVYL